MKNRLFLLLLVSLVLGFSMVEASGLYSNMISIWSPNQTGGNSQASNLSRNIVLNASIMNSTFGSAVNLSSGNHVVNLTFFWKLNGVVTPVLNVSIVNTSANTNLNGSFTNLSFSTATLSDGVYTLNVTAYNRSFIDDALGFASNISLVSFLVDNTPPNVTNIYVGNITDGMNLSAGLAAVTGNYLLNVSLQVNDSVSIQSIKANLTTSNGLVSQSSVFSGITNITYMQSYAGNNSIYVLNGTFAPSSGVNAFSTGNYTPAAINVSALSDGVYTIYIDVNDTHGNRNVSTFTFTVDRTAPTVSVSCTSNPKSGEIVTCTCTTSDATSGLTSLAAFSGDSDGSESTTASSVGSYTSSVCRATDFAGNSASGTGSWTVVAAQTSGSGPGGSPNGVVVKALGQFNKKVWTSVNKGETVSLDVADAEVAVSKVSFTAAQNAYGAILQVQKVSALPKEVPALDKNVYKYVSITQVNLAKAIEGEGVAVIFKVSVDWLTEKGLTKDNVALHRFVNGGWVTLDTTFSEEDGGYITYTAQTPGFSYFAIAEGKSVAAPVVEQKDQTAMTDEKDVVASGKDASVGTSTSSTSTSASSSTTGETQVMGSSNSMWWVAGVVALVVIIGLVWYMMSRKKPSEEHHKKK